MSETREARLRAALEALIEEWAGAARRHREQGASVAPRVYENVVGKLRLLLSTPPEAPPEPVRDLRWTLDNIYTIARREAKRDDMWGHVARLCEQAGCAPRDVLRDNGGSVNGD